MKLFRSILFWTHLTAGVLASVVILVMSFTGVVLALKPQMQNWIERDVRSVTPQSSPRLGAYQLLTAVRTAKPDASPQAVVVERDPGTAVAVNLGREGTVYANPYTGAVLGSGSARTTQFFQTMTSWHRYMGATGEYRAAGRSATGISNLAFLVLALSGLYLWLPKQISFQHLKPILWFRRTSTGRARDFNWHNTIGFWCLIPIVIMTISGAVISYPWASNLVYRLTGSPVPAGRGGGPGGPAVAAQGRGGASRSGAPGAEAAGRGRAQGSAESGAMLRGGPAPAGESARSAEPTGPRGVAPNQQQPPEPGPRPIEGNAQRPAVIPAALDQLWSRAEQQVPTWSLISMRLPNGEGGPVAFTITDGANWNAFARSNLTLNSANAEVIQWQPYEAGSLGQKARGWLRFAHTGELGGLVGQVIAGIGCLGGVFLVYTGVSLALRRLWNWALWKRLRSSGRDPLGVALSGAPAVAVRDTVME